MEIQRAKEILASPVMANVTLNDQPVYLEKVDDQKKTVPSIILRVPTIQSAFLFQS